MTRLILYAPNINQGGGLVLLNELLKACPTKLDLAYLDNRALDKISNPPENIIWVRSTFLSRLKGELSLRINSKDSDTVICLHNQPPLFPSAAKLIVFIQNRYVFGATLTTGYSFTKRIRINFERLCLRWCLSDADLYIVQTPSMAQELKTRLLLKGKKQQPVEIIPFSAPIKVVPPGAPRFDFIYPADDAPHKNHKTLLQAWIELSHLGMRPSLLLTINPSSQLASSIERAVLKYSLNITCVGFVSRERLSVLYASTRALVYPSVSESFGIPLIEASTYKMDIIASELDYVRDVCVPSQTFDPMSPTSIRRAVMRYLSKPELPVEIKPASEFWERIFSAGVNADTHRTRFRIDRPDCQ
jgi:glycosyltransferase involved in cell wall biosynthesis